MKLNEYIKKLQAVEKEVGGNLLVVHSSDDEGNSFQPVYFDPSAGHFDEGDREFGDEGKVNAVCIN